LTSCESAIDKRLRIEAVRTLFDLAVSFRHAAVEMIGADRDRAVVRAIRGAFAGGGDTVRRVDRVDVRAERPLGEGESATPPGKRDPMRPAPGSLLACDDVTVEMEVRRARTSRSPVSAQA